MFLSTRYGVNEDEGCIIVEAWGSRDKKVSAYIYPQGQESENHIMTVYKASVRDANTLYEAIKWLMEA